MNSSIFFLLVFYAVWAFLLKWLAQKNNALSVENKRQTAIAEERLKCLIKTKCLLMQALGQRVDDPMLEEIEGMGILTSVSVKRKRCYREIIESINSIQSKTEKKYGAEKN